MKGPLLLKLTHQHQHVLCLHLYLFTWQKLLSKGTQMCSRIQSKHRAAKRVLQDTVRTVSENEKMLKPSLVKGYRNDSKNISDITCLNLYCSFVQSVV